MATYIFSCVHREPVKNFQCPRNTKTALNMFKYFPKNVSMKEIILGSKLGVLCSVAYYGFLAAWKMTVNNLKGAPVCCKLEQCTFRTASSELISSSSMLGPNPFLQTRGFEMRGPLPSHGTERKLASRRLSRKNEINERKVDLN